MDPEQLPKPTRRALRTSKILQLKAVGDVIANLPTRQRGVFFICCDYFRLNDQLPSMAMLASRMGVSSVNSAQEVVRGLERKGLLERNEQHRYRFARVEGMSVADYARHLTAGAGRPAEAADVADAVH